MDAIEHLQDYTWKHPSDYGGFSPDGDYCIMSRNRDSDILIESNWAAACRQLGAEPYDNGRSGGDADSFPDRPNVYHWRAGHWACGWVEYLMVRHDASESVLQEAGEIVCSIADYPILDESDFSERECNAAAEYWQQMSLRERVELMRDCGESIFAARRDWFPDSTGRVQESLLG